MNLPNYFLADLPPDAVLTPMMVTEACQTLKRNREKFLAQRSTQDMVNLLCHVAQNWLDAEYPLRKFALAEGPKQTGFSSATLANGLTAFFKQFTPENFNALLTQDLGDGVASDEWRAAKDLRHLWRGPEFLIYIAAGNIPNPTLMSIALGLLTRSAQFVKCASGTSFLPRLFAHSIYEAERKIGSCLEIAEWRGGKRGLEQALFAEADCITATGSDETLAAIRQHVPIETRFLGYGHRVSFGYIAGGAVNSANAERIVASAAADVVAWNQLGCLSPHVIYVENSSAIAADQFAQLLAEELERREAAEPRGEVATETAAAILSRRAIYEIRAAHSPDTRFWQSKNSTAWTVVYEADPRFQLSCLNRFVYVKGVTNLQTTLENAAGVHGKVSTVGLAAPETKINELATQLAHWGVTRVCPFGQMQNPPLTWRHDGRPALGDLVVWTDLEF